MAEGGSKTTRVMDTEDFSLETPSEPTDFSAISNPDDDDNETTVGNLDETSQATAIAQKQAKGRIESNKITRQLLQRKQLAHDNQLLNIELSQKNLLIENMKAETMQREEELEERLSDAIHQKQLLQARLEAQLTIQEDESKRRQDEIKYEMHQIITKQRELEAMNARLTEKAGSVRTSLTGSLQISEDFYLDLRGMDDSQISLKNFVAMKLYEAVTPLKELNNELKVKLKHQENDIGALVENNDQVQEQCATCQRELADLQLEHQRTMVQLADAKSKINHGNYKIENYDKVKRERDDFEAELHELKQKHSYLDTQHNNVSKERDELHIKLQSLCQTESLLNQDKEYLSKQLIDHQNRAMYADEKVQQLTHELELTKRAREDMYEKYANSRDHYKSEYEARLREELEKIRLKTDTEIDRLKSSTREMYERENRNLREARDAALSERDRASAAERDAQNKYEQLLNDFHQLQIGSDNKAADLHNDLKIKSFELERTQMVYEDTARNLKKVQQENEKLQEKAEMVTKEFYQLQLTCDRKISELEAMMTNKSTKLEAYEKVEKELDDVVMQAAELDDGCEAERVLFSYGYGANIPSNAKRRLKQSVDLARRVLQLERANTSLRNEIQREKGRSDELMDKLKSANSILDAADQPYQYLVESVRTRDDQLKKQTFELDSLKAQFRLVEQEKLELTKTKNQLSLDLERLLNQREDLVMMKKMVNTMYSKQHSVSPSTTPRTAAPRSARTRSKSPSGSKGAKSPMQKRTDDFVVQPEPTLFTNREPSWYEKLKSKNQRCSPSGVSAQHSRVYGTAS